MNNYGLYSYLMATIAYGGLLLIAVWRLRKYRSSGAFFIAVLFSFLWAGFSSYVLHSEEIYTSSILPLETLRDLSWYYFLLTMIYAYRGDDNENGAGADKFWQSRYVQALFVASLFVFIIEWFPGMLYAVDQLFAVDVRLLAHVSFAIFGLILVEQLYRNTLAENRWTIKFFCIGLGAIFIYDFIFYSKSMLFSEMDTILWNARGVVNAIVVPLLVISVIRLQDNSHSFTISRKIIFHTTSLVSTGLYLILMSLAGYYIKKFGGNWGEIAQILFIFLGILVLFILLFSGTIRAMVKVYFNKHFLQYNYDYREEWISLSRQLAKMSSFNELSKVIIKTLADLVDSSGGGLWIKNENGDYYLADNDVAMIEGLDLVFSDAPVIKLMREKQWVIDFLEYEDDPEVYDELDFSNWLEADKDIWLTVPLLQQNELEAFVVLTKSRAARKLNWEDHDLLKTVGMQLANALVLSKASDALSTARQFEAYSRLSAFMIHDLKNLVAQVSLIVKNAEKHKHNPEFIDDAIETLENVVIKMQNLVGQLRKRNLDAKRTQINLVDVINDVARQQSANLPRPECVTQLNQCCITGDYKKITSILGHLMQNAQDATDDAGWVKIVLTRDDEKAYLSIADNGMGMDEKFISERLFKPFDTTKGNAGMGIGVYEAKDYILNHSGKISVTSEVNKGTTFYIELPLLKTAKQPAEGGIPANVIDAAVQS